ncbi:TPA: transposase [Salmonella enterica]|uniref:Transposase n=1 Tax=Salmonella enterica TaxID=28901 RepID=A0A757VZ40_SALER|nr:transposase [Salmonella enterica]
MSAAFWYLLNRKEALAYFCEDGLAEIDNNAAERALRSVCLGKRTGCSSVMIMVVTEVRWCTA